MMKEISSHDAPVWTFIYSLRREDAARLGYETGESWRRLLLAHQTELAAAMKNVVALSCGICAGLGFQDNTKALLMTRAMAELTGKAAGYCKGKGGSMHIADVAVLHSLGANGIVCAGIPIAAGSALVSKIKGDKHVTLCFFGDSASNQGTFHEAVNMAAAWKLPVVFLCENNNYGVSVNIHSVTNTDTIAVRAQAYNIPGKTVDGNDPVTVYEAVKEAVDYAREGNGPSIVECMTFRHQGHYCGDPANYRPASYMEEAHKKDAIPNMRKRLLDGVATEEEILAVEKAVEDEMEAAYQFANESAYPDPSEASRQQAI